MCPTGLKSHGEFLLITKVSLRFSQFHAHVLSEGLKQRKQNVFGIELKDTIKNLLVTNEESQPAHGQRLVSSRSSLSWKIKVQLL